MAAQTKLIKRDRRALVYLTEAQSRELARAANAAQMSVSDYIVWRCRLRRVKVEVSA